MSGVWTVVVMFGGEEVTAACIESLLAQEHPVTVLLVDNASHDGGGARLRARFPSIRYLDAGSNTGYTGGNNRGIAHALAQGADHVFVVNNDTVVHPACVRFLLEAATSRTAMVAPKIMYFRDPSRVWYAGGDFLPHKAVGHHRHFQQADPGLARVPEPVTFASGCAFLMPATAARALGGFAEDYFMYCEDVELSLRARRRGFEIVYQPAALVYHKDEPAAHPSPFQIRLRDRNRRRMVRAHYGIADRVRFAAWFYPTRMLRLAQYALRGDWTRAQAIAAGMTER